MAKKKNNNGLEMMVDKKESSTVADWRLSSQFVLEGSLEQGNLVIEDASGNGNNLKLVTVGDFNDPESVVSTLIREHPYFQLREDLGTSPRVFYLPPHEEMTT